MSNLFALTIPDSAAGLLVTYGAGAVIRVQASSTQGGSYSGITPTLPIVTAVQTYAVYDSAGAAGWWYEYRYEQSGGGSPSAYSAPFQPVAAQGLYATTAEFKAWNGMPSAADAVQDPLILIAISAASQAIRSACQQDFATPSGVSESRLFELGGFLPPRITIDPIVDATNLVLAFDDNSGTYPVTVSTGYDLTPLNAPARGFPYTGISFRTYAVVPSWRLNGPLVKATSTRWGWPATPAVVHEAALVQSSRYYKRKDSPFGIAGAPAEGNILRLLAKLDPDVEAMLGNDLQRWREFVL